MERCNKRPIHLVEHVGGLLQIKAMSKIQRHKFQSVTEGFCVYLRDIQFKVF